MTNFRIYILTFLLFNWAGSVCASVEKIALVIGNNIGLKDDVPLRYATSDARRVYDVLTTLGGVAKERSYLLLDKPLPMVEEAFTEIAGRAKELKLNGNNVEIILYYSGHGSPDAFHLNGKTFPVDDIKQRFEAMNADLKILIADACNSGSLIQSKGGAISAPYEVKFNNEINVKGSVIITSSSAGELSHESQDLKGSLFTHYLVSGLLGAADMDNDGNITLWEAYTFAKTNTKREGLSANDFKQSPGFDIDVQGTENLVLSQTTKGQSMLRFINCAPGKYRLMEAASLEPVAEIIINSDKAVVLALPAQAYVVQHNTDNAAYIGSFDLSWKGEVVVTQKSFKPYPLDILVAKGGAGLHYKPFKTCIRIMTQENVPLGGNYLLYPEAAFSLDIDRLTIEMFTGYDSDILTGKFVTIRRKTILPGIAARYAFLNKTRVRLGAGLSLCAILMQQEPIRPNENAIRIAGYPALPVTWGRMFGIGASFTGQYNLPWSLAASLEWRPGILLSTGNDEKTKWFFRMPIGLSLGFRF